MPLDLPTLRSQWNQVLDHLERTDRVTWIAFFDARLSSLDGRTLTLDFSDSRKFGAPHEYSAVRDRQIQSLVAAIHSITGERLEVVEK